MNKIFKGVKFFKESRPFDTPTFKIFAKKKEKEIIRGWVEFPTDKKAVLTGLYYHEAIKDDSKYENHGFGTAILFFRVLYAFYGGCLKIKTMCFDEERTGKMYELLGMKKKNREYVGEYPKELIQIIQKNAMVKVMCKIALKGGVVLDNLIETYKDVAEDLINSKFKDFGNKLLKAAEELEKRTA